METLKITSELFDCNGWISDCCSGYGDNISPDIIIDGLPEGTISLAILMDDLDHPIFNEFNHWIAWNIPCVNEIPKGIEKGAITESPIYAEQGIGYGRHEYNGPKPPFNGNHRYRIGVYAIDKKLTLKGNARKKSLLQVIEGHTLAYGELISSYQRKRKQ